MLVAGTKGDRWARHAQTDGWLSEDSAKIYEVSTETLFLGRQDAMQRQALVPLASFMRGQPGRAGAGVRLLELACGTGRFASFIKARRAAPSSGCGGVVEVWLWYSIES